MQENKNEYIKINSYQDIWNYEKKIYTIGKNIKLLVPLSVKEFLYIFMFLALLILITSVLKISLHILLYIIIPILLTKTVKFLSLDGKNPIQFVADYIKYALIYKQKISLFEACSLTDNAAYIVWQVAWRRRRNTAYYIENINPSLLSQLGFTLIGEQWIYTITRWHFLCIDNKDIYGIITNRISNDTLVDYEELLSRLIVKHPDKVEKVEQLISNLITNDVLIKN